MTPLERADRAKQLLSDEVLNAAFAEVREQLVRQLEALPFGDTESQHHTTLQLQSLRQIAVQLRKWAEEVTIDREKRRQEKFLEAKKQEVIRYINSA